jgi:hypothetical protein
VRRSRKEFFCVDAKRLIGGSVTVHDVAGDPGSSVRARVELAFATDLRLGENRTYAVSRKSPLVLKVLVVLYIIATTVCHPLVWAPVHMLIVHL